MTIDAADSSDILTKFRMLSWVRKRLTGLLILLSMVVSFAAMLVERFDVSKRPVGGGELPSRRFFV